MFCYPSSMETCRMGATVPRSAGLKERLSGSRVRGLLLRIRSDGSFKKKHHPEKMSKQHTAKPGSPMFRASRKPLQMESELPEFEMQRNPGIVQEIAATRTFFRRWTGLSPRHKLLFATAVAFVICNMDKVNLSVAIIPMAREFGWSATVSGLVQSAFFYGYTVFQMPSGVLNTKFSGARMLPIGVGLWSAATAVVPLLGSSVVGLCLARATVGIGEGLAPASLTDMVASVVPVRERSRSMTFVGAALYMGSLMGLLLSPVFVENFGWPSVFYVFGGTGLLWTMWWLRLVQGIKRTDPVAYEQLIGVKRRNVTTKREVPWRAMLRCRAVHALMYTHFCNNWFGFAILAWLPSYFTDTLGLGLMRAAQISLIPPLAGMTVSAFAGPWADSLIARGWNIGVVRKVMQCIAFIGPSLCLLIASYPPLVSKNIIFIAAALGLTSFSLSGLYCNHQDLSPTYSSLLFGITNTAGALTGVIGVAATGALLDMTKSWSWALFAPAIFFFITGSIVFVLHGSGEEADFSNNEPFAIERLFRRFTREG